MATATKRLGDGTNNEAEAKVALMVIGLGRALGVRNIHLEGDSLIITQAITKLTTNARHLQKYTWAINKELEHFDNYKISHIRRQGNKEADVLSKWAVSFGEIGEHSIEDYRHKEFDQSFGDNGTMGM